MKIPEMVEFVARAIYENRNGVGCTPWGHQSNAHKAPYLSDAGAAFKAIRKPTEAMILAGVHHDNMGDMEGRWTAMIDAATRGE